ncbi:hypothetical protein E2C01_005895 [Portunus trituberculatus]|uniref:Uncharacterized protein n=1 Tax=Portunus trituberculatus TaxID=210409 RepID=A0A5B7D0B9_PORTR|nr:hypothetical protein [Portunus trituberculatus]
MSDNLPPLPSAGSQGVTTTSGHEPQHAHTMAPLVLLGCLGSFTEVVIGGGRPVPPPRSHLCWRSVVSAGGPPPCPCPPGPAGSHVLVRVSRAFCWRALISSSLTSAHFIDLYTYSYISPDGCARQRLQTARVALAVSTADPAVTGPSSAPSYVAVIQTFCSLQLREQNTPTYITCKEGDASYQEWLPI